MDGSVPSPAGSGGVGGVTSVPYFQSTSAKRGAKAEQAGGHRHGASGARSRLHFRTVSPVPYVRLSKFLHSCRIGIHLKYRVGFVTIGRHSTFSRGDWQHLRDATPMTLGSEELALLQGVSDCISMGEVEAIYLPLSRLLNLHVAAAQRLHDARGLFIGSCPAKVPFVVGIAGSVAAGKSTTARVLQALLARWPDHPRVELVTTDGFLFPNAELARRDIMDRKGFPESYDVRRLLRFLEDVKSGVPESEVPLYSHVIYDVTDETTLVHQPDILILEGINVLQVSGPGPVYVSDYFDFSIFLDAGVADLRRWYVERFLTLRSTVFTREDSYFRRYAHLDADEARWTANDIWTRINERNLFENILPTRERADLVLRKGADHGVVRVDLRRL
jgi:type I pantothenate kinase